MYFSESLIKSTTSSVKVIKDNSFPTCSYGSCSTISYVVHLLSVRKNSLDVCCFFVLYLSLSRLGTCSSQSYNLSMLVNIDADYGVAMSPMQNFMNSLPISLVKSSPIVLIKLKKFLLVISVAPNLYTKDIAEGPISPLALIRSKGIIAKTFFFVML